MKTIVVLLAIVCSVFTGCSKSKTKTDLFKEGAKSSVRVLTPEGKPHGSGFVVFTPHGNKVVITNEHVCYGLKEVRLRYAGLGGIETMEIPLKMDEDKDLCVIPLKPEFSDALTPMIRAEFSGLRQEVYALGYPVDYPLSLADGFSLDRGYLQIASIGRQCENPIMTFFGIPICLRTHHVVITNVLIYPGNSGSPAINDEGEVIGVFNSASSDTHFGNYIPLEDLNTFIKDL